MSLRLGKILSAWNLAAITTIFKNKGNTQSTENYRPANLSSIACKIMDSILIAQGKCNIDKQTVWFSER